MRDKPLLPTEFPNLPYLTDGENYITESETICLYICNLKMRIDLVGESIDDRLQISRMKGLIDDLRYDIGTLAYNQDFENALPKVYASKITPRL